MGQRGEVFSARLMKDDVSYFFNVKENIYGDLFLNIAQSVHTRTGRFERQSIVVYPEKLDEFMAAMQKKYDFIIAHAPKGKPLDYKPNPGAKPPRPSFKKEEPVVGRTYVFRTMEDEWGDYSLTITESKSSADATFNLRQTVTVYQEDLGEFVRKLQEAVDFLNIRKTQQPARQAVKVQRRVVVRKNPAASAEQ